MIRSRQHLAACLALLTLLPTSVVMAQTELAQERASLRGVKGFYLSLNLEGVRSLVEQEALDFKRLEDAIRTRLNAAGLTLLPDINVSPEARVPYLHVHVNMMQAEQGQVPFAIEIHFFQSVRLVRDAAFPLVASTWSTSLVGLAYHNQLTLIPETVVDLVGTFIADFQGANSP